MVRRARPEDAPVLTDIALAAKRHWGYPESWIQKWIPQLTITARDIQDAEVYCAVGEDRPIGFYRLIQRPPLGILEDLWVSPVNMGAGVGRALFEHAVAQCGAARLEVLQLEADPHAQGFYEKMGMHKVGEHPVDLIEARNLPIMEMQL